MMRAPRFLRRRVVPEMPDVTGRPHPEPAGSCSFILLRNKNQSESTEHLQDSCHAYRATISVRATVRDIGCDLNGSERKRHGSRRCQGRQLRCCSRSTSYHRQYRNHGDVLADNQRGQVIPGFFEFPPVRPGNYTITVNATSMETLEGKFVFAGWADGKKSVLS